MLNNQKKSPLLLASLEATSKDRSVGAKKKASSGIEPLKKVLTVPRINHSAMTPTKKYFFCVTIWRSRPQIGKMQKPTWLAHLFFYIE